VRSGETLYAIAAAAYPEQASEMSRVMTAIVARNPGAFLNGDVNRMLTGVMLILPAKEDTAKAPGPAADARHAATSTYTVMPGDTLYAIARRELGVSGDGLAQTVARLYADNADAFLDGDRDRLQVGAVLRLGVSADATVPVAIPTSAPATVAAVVPAGASVEHSEQRAAARKDAAAGDQAARSDVSIATVPTVTAVPLPQLSELVDQVSAADETITSEEASSSALRSRLDALLGELESLRARDAELTAKTEAVTAALMNRRLDAASGSPAPAPATAQPASSSAGSGIAALTTGPAAGGAGFGFWVGAGALILALLGGAVFARRRGGAAPEPRAVADEEATRRKLAEVRERHGSTGSFEAEDLQAAGADVAPRDPGNVHMTEAAHASALAKEAAVHLAYGDYKTAKRNIEEAIRMDPHRDEHKMLLITVYENTGEHAKAREIVDDLLTRREQLPRELRQQVEQLRRHAGG
jgi:pilus assembly protein FimV